MIYKSTTTRRWRSIVRSTTIFAFLLMFPLRKLLLILPFYNSFILQSINCETNEELVLRYFTTNICYRKTIGNVYVS